MFRCDGGAATLECINLIRGNDRFDFGSLMEVFRVWGWAARVGADFEESEFETVINWKNEDCIEQW